MSQLRKFYPEVDAGGFSRVDGSISFYTRVNALLDQRMTVLDFGAGRGQQLLETSSPFRTRLATLQGKVRKVIGADVDPAVLENPFMDESYVIDLSKPMPFEDDTFDLIVSDWVLEHVVDPAAFSNEAYRVLKPGGWFCARTPNRWGITGLAANLVPNDLHVTLLSKLQPERQNIDVFPTVYKLNTRAQLRHHFSTEYWDHFSYISNAEPPYIQNSRAAMALAMMLWRATPSYFHTVLNVFLRSKAQAE